MAGNAKNIRLGPCRVIWGVEDLGFTKGGVEVSITSTQVSITSDQFGETPMDKYVTSRTVNVKVPLIETIPGKLDLILNGGDGTAELATVQTVAGLSMRNASQSLVLHPISKADDDYSEDFVVIRAGVIPNIEATYDSDNERVWFVTFTSFPYYGEFGDIMEADRSGVVVYGDRSAVVANGGLYRASQRSTVGTYFDKNGILQTADAYVTRPNYVYQNGIWKQQGWLMESQATNVINQSPSSIDISHGVSFTQTTSSKFPNQYVYEVTLSKNSGWSYINFPCNGDGKSTYTQSLFVNIVSSDASSTALYVTGENGHNAIFPITGTSFNSLNAYDVGDNWSKIVANNICDNSGFRIGKPGVTNDLNLVIQIACVQVELETSNAPSSPIMSVNSSTTRAAD